jgi:hypothetical protein
MLIKYTVEERLFPSYKKKGQTLAQAYNFVEVGKTNFGRAVSGGANPSGRAV